MKMLLFRIIFLTIIFVTVTSTVTEPKYKVFCFYDSRSFSRRESGQMIINNLEPVLSKCTHLLYGYAGISSRDYKLISLNQNLDTGEIYEYFRRVNDLKSRFPNLKVLLSVGGGVDLDTPEKYLKMLEGENHRRNFIESTLAILKQYGFDGVNLGWQFPPNKGKKPSNSLVSMWHKLKKTVGGEKVVDEHHEKHKEEFTDLIRTMKTKFASENLMITASVLPNVNSSLFYDYSFLMNNLDYIILHAYDFYTPIRNERQADHAHPLKCVNSKYPELNADAVVMKWLNNSFPDNKIIFGIPMFGRVWLLEEDANPSGRPPIKVIGAAREGPSTGEKGLRSYFEICNRLVTDRPTKTRYLAQYHDIESNCGPYAYKHGENKKKGQWISYENIDDVVHKVSYVKQKNLAGIAIVDLSLDDFNGVCSEGKFPLFTAAVSNLNY